MPYVKLHSLVVLHLWCVSIDDDTIQDLTFSCRSMKVFSMELCFCFESLDICDNNKLAKVVIVMPCGNFKLKRISINVQTLVKLELCYNEDERFNKIIVSSICHNLKCLSLSSIHIEAKWLQRMLTSFPLLEHLHLQLCVLQEVMKLSSQALKIICIDDCKNLVEAEFDAHNLHSFEYCGRTMPRLYAHNLAVYRKVELLNVDVEDVDSLWFNFLRYLNFQDLTFNIPVCQDKAISFNAEDYTGIQFTPFDLNNMKFYMRSSNSINYAALLDGLFWNLRPRVLSLVHTNYAPDSVKEILKCLGAEEPHCYCSENLECWRHLLKEIKLIDNVIGLKRDTVFNAMTLDNFTNCLDDSVTEAQKMGFLKKFSMMETLSFRLSWC